MPALPPAAWHPDPHNPKQLRWWDGTRWTSDTAQSTTSPAPAAISAPSAGTPEAWEASARRHRNAWRVIGIVLGTLVIGGLLARWSPVAIGLAFLALLGVAIFVLIARPLPRVGLRTRRSGLAALGVAALLVTGGGIANAGTVSTDAPTASTPNTFVDTAQPSADPTPTPTPTTFTVKLEESPIPFTQTTVDDPQRDKGTSAIVTAGADGISVTTYRLTLVDGVEVARELVSEVVQKKPVSEVTAVGTRVPAPKPVPLVQPRDAACDANYTGACVPIASDVDCAGGSGNGPAYVQGPVRIVGSDVYDLDRDGDGIACD